MKKLLNGKWQFCESGINEWMSATVPGCNYLDLMDNDKIPDPFYKTNEKDVYWVALKNWEYKRTFSVSEKELKSDKVYLCADMLDTVCRVFVNEKLIAEPKNCFIAYRFDVKEYLICGENEIRIEFLSPVEYITEKNKINKCPHNGNGIDGIPHIRKPGCHFGWDWGPILPPSGITEDIYLEFSDVAEISDVAIKQLHDNGEAEVKVETKFDAYNNDDLSVEVTLTSPDGKVLEKQSGGVCKFTVKNPELWWTYDLAPDGKPKLYKVSVKLLKGKKVIDENEKSIGIRTIELNRSKDEYGSNFQFILNGIPLFIKGVNYIPPDSFVTRFTDDKMNYLFDAVQFSNMNMIRVWGGGFYASEKFYDECDKRGILIWQDFMFACQPYPFFDPELLENIKEEIRFVVSRIRSHASLALWCGNNEIEAMSAGWMTMRNYIDWTEKFFHNILEPEIRKYDAQTEFIPGSPCGVSHNKGVDSDNVGDTHLWAVWHGLQPMNYYRGRMTRFCSEFGFESLPDIKTIKTFADESDYALDSEVFTAHQKCNSGNDKMIYYIASRFNLPERFEDFIYLSQVTQQECVSDATEHWRRNKGRCNGAMYWQLNDCWPVCSWAGMDYYGNYKALQYTSRRFNAPISVSIEDGKKQTRIVVINDTTENKELVVRYKLFDFREGTKAKGEVSVLVNSVENKEIFVFDMQKLKNKFDLKRTGLLAELVCDGEVISRKTVLFDKEKKLDMPKAKLSKEVKINGDKIEITVTSDYFARLVRVESLVSTLPFSDNYFDLLPGESKTVTMPIDKSVDEKEQAEKITLFCCTDVESQKNVIAENMKMAKIFLQPMNIANYVWYGKPNK